MLFSPFAIENFKCLIVLFNELITYFCYASRSHANVFQHAQLTGSFDTSSLFDPFFFFFFALVERRVFYNPKQILVGLKVH